MLRLTSLIAFAAVALMTSTASETQAAPVRGNHCSTSVRTCVLNLSGPLPMGTACTCKGRRGIVTN